MLCSATADLSGCARRRPITQKEEYNIQNAAKVWNQENKKFLYPQDAIIESK